MDSLFHFTAVMLIIIWGIGLFVLDAGIIIHVLLLIAVLATALAIVQGKRKFV